jgi:hypothetical protein
MRTLALAATLVLSLASVAQPQLPPSLNLCLVGSVEALVPKPPVVSAPFQDGVIEAWRFQCLESVGSEASYVPIIRATGINSCEPVGVAAEFRYHFFPFPPAHTFRWVLHRFGNSPSAGAAWTAAAGNFRRFIPISAPVFRVMISHIPVQRNRVRFTPCMISA